MSALLTDGEIDWPRLGRALTTAERKQGRTLASCYLAAAVMIALPPRSVIVYPVTVRNLCPYVTERIMFWLKHFSRIYIVQVSYSDHAKIRLSSGTEIRIVMPERETAHRFDGIPVALYADTLGEFLEFSQFGTAIYFESLKRSRPETARAALMESRIYQDLVRDLRRRSGLNPMLDTD